MQRNPGCPTIEAELEAALVKAGAISEQNAGSFMKVGLLQLQQLQLSYL
jgi:tRNA U38,U39,U40 pseudouridine synthase TruA